MKILVFLLILVSTIAFAGQGGSGGVGFLCDSSVYLADTYSLLEKDEAYPDNFVAENIEPLNQSSPDEILNAIMGGLKAYFEQTKKGVQFKEIETARNQLTFKYVESVPRTHDDHILWAPLCTIFQESTIIQLARQDKQGIVQVANAAKQMSPFEQAMLKFHEILLRWEIDQKTFNGDTTSVRDWVEDFDRISLIELRNFVVKPDFGTHDPSGIITPLCEKELFITAEQEMAKMGLPKEDYFSQIRINSDPKAAAKDSAPVEWESHQTDGTLVYWFANAFKPIAEGPFDGGWGCDILDFHHGVPAPNLPSH